MIIKPQILTLNLSSKSNSLLKERNFNIYEGSLGKIIETANGKYEHKYCLLNYEFPPNFHEYDVVIIDLSNKETISYHKDEHTRRYNKNMQNSFLLCEYPQTIFDPRGFSANILQDYILELMKEDSQLIVFQDENEIIEYQITEENGNHPRKTGVEECSIYDFLCDWPQMVNKNGVETNIPPINHHSLSNFLEKYNEEFTYEVVFGHRHSYDKEKDKNIPSQYFIPLVQNLKEETVSYIEQINRLTLFVFPKLVDNSKFIVEFLESVAPDINPAIYPLSTKYLWAKESIYSLPNQVRLTQDLIELKDKYEKDKQKKEDEIAKNHDEFKFLHELLISTDDELVKVTIKFLEFLGFDNVVDMDEISGEIKEEDIQIENEKGLLLIEVKGIGGTSKDTDCSQISKIINRRSKQRGGHDVYGLYIVNNQRHLPPEDRKYPPFTKHQIKDAKYDERGLVTTYQLFRLYFDIVNEIISKEDAREKLYEFGFIEFTPKNLVYIDTVTELFSKGYVSIVKLDKHELKVGQKLYVEKNKQFKIVEILEMKKDEITVNEANVGEIGIKTDIEIKKNSNIWIKID